MKHLYVYNEKQWEEACCKKYYTDRSLGVLELDRGIVLPSVESEKMGTYGGGVCDRGFSFVAGFLRNDINPAKNHLYYGLNTAYSVPRSEIIYRDECVIFGGVLVGHFGHFILESMGRLWYVLQNDKLETKIVFTMILEAKKWIFDFFRLLGINENRICFIDKPTQFAKIIIPEESIHSWDSYTKEYLIPYQKITQKINPGNIKKVYLTRTALDQGGALCCNEEYFEKFYKQKGFSIVAPEQYTIDEQISILYGAEEIVTTLGSLSHFAMFCKKGTRFTILTRVDNDILPAQCLVNEASEVKWCIVDVSLNFLFATRVYGVNQIGVTKFWKMYVKDMYGEIIEKDSIQDSCYEYLKKWCTFYSNPHQYKKIASKDFFEFFNRMHKVLCGIELDKKNYDIGMTKVDLQKKLLKYENYINEFEQDKIKYVQLQSSVEIYKYAFELIKNFKFGIFTAKYKDKQNKMINSLLELANQEQKRAVLFCEVHVASIGWKQREIEGYICGDITQHLQIEAIKLCFDKLNNHIYYSTYTEYGGWDKECMDGQVSGTVGKHIPLKGLRIRLDDFMTKNYTILYRVYGSNSEWSGWKYNNEGNCVPDGSVLEAMQIKIERKK